MWRWKVLFRTVVIETWRTSQRTEYRACSRCRTTFESKVGKLDNPQIPQITQKLNLCNLWLQHPLETRTSSRPQHRRSCNSPANSQGIQSTHRVLPTESRTS